MKAISVGTRCRPPLGGGASWLATGILLIFLSTDRAEATGPATTSCNGTSYFLSRTLLRVRLVKVRKPNAAARFELALAPQVTPAGATPLCLELRGPSALTDQIAIEMTDGGLLERVGARPLDAAASITKQQILLGDTLGDPLLRRAKIDGGEIAAIFEFDPFDIKRATNVAGILRQHGFCLLVVGPSLGLRDGSPARYCQGERRMVPHKAHALPTELNRAAVHYRPRQPYDVRVYARTGRNASRWRLLRTETVQLENASPLLSIAIDPEQFTVRRATLTFKEGVLSGAVFDKSGNPDAFITIPLEVVRSIARLPTETIRIRIDQMSDSTTLEAAQKQLIDMMATRR